MGANYGDGGWGSQGKLAGGWMEICRQDATKHDWCPSLMSEIGAKSSWKSQKIIIFYLQSCSVTLTNASSSSFNLLCHFFTRVHQLDRPVRIIKVTAHTSATTCCWPLGKLFSLIWFVTNWSGVNKPRATAESEWGKITSTAAHNSGSKCGCSAKYLAQLGNHSF